jgi:hypothetical protein
MTERAIKLLVWGLLIVLIDIRIVTVDIIHDLIGYIFLYKGIKRLPESRWMNLAKISLIILGIFSVIEIFGFSTINMNEMNQDFTMELAFAGILAILSLFFKLNLLSGLLETAVEYGLKDQHPSMQKFKMVYLMFNLLYIMSLPSMMVFREDYVLFLVFLMVAGFIVEIVYIVKINSFKRFIPSEEYAS